MSKTEKILYLQWGWITPGTGMSNLVQQRDYQTAFLEKAPTPVNHYVLAVHCGWWLDAKADAEIRNLTANCPEPGRSIEPCSKDEAKLLSEFTGADRLELVVYPYAACVAECTSLEALLRTFRFSRDIIDNISGKKPRIAMNHDAVYSLEWGTVQMPQIAKILGFDILIGSNTCMVRAPDGSSIKLIGGKNSSARFKSQELTVAAKKPIGKTYELINLDEYLDIVQTGKDINSMQVGSKSWFGGSIDSLLMVQNIKSAELRLPGLEALSIQIQGRNLNNLWKKSFILMDNHLLWQCHNYKAYYLGESENLLNEVHACEKNLLDAFSEDDPNSSVIYNPTPWKRSFALDIDGVSQIAKDIPGWGIGNLEASPKKESVNKIKDNCLSNDCVSFTLNDCGGIIKYEDENGIKEFDGLGRIMRITESKQDEEFELESGEHIENIAGSLMLAAEIELPGSDISEAFFEASDLIGNAFIMETRLFYQDGSTSAYSPYPLQMLHWGGSGLPRRSGDISPCHVDVKDAVKLEIKLHFITEGELKIGNAGIALPSGEMLNINRWKVSVNYRNKYSFPENTKREVIKNDEAVKQIRFTGELPQVKYSLNVILRKFSRALEYELNLSFPEPTPLGLSTPPFSVEDGSLLGVLCERPYIPGIAITAHLPASCAYYSDKSGFISRALTKHEKTWHTDRTDWWLGMSPFIGMNMACADYGSGQVAMLTRGINHFFRERKNIKEQLGLSLGASIIHQRAQGHSVPDESPYAGILKRSDHNPYIDTSFLFAHGEYKFNYAFAIGQSGEQERIKMWHHAREFACPPQPQQGRTFKNDKFGVSCLPEDVVISGLENYNGKTLLRVINMSSETRLTTITLSFELRSAHIESDGTVLYVNKNKIKLKLSPNAIRELTLELK